MSTVILLFINIIISVCFSSFRIFNVLPAIFLMMLTYFAINLKIDEATVAGALIGFMIDVFYGNVFGLNTFIYMWFAVIINILVKEYFSNDTFIVLVMTMFVILIYDSFMFLISFMFEGKTYFMSYLTKIIIPEMIYSLLLFFPLCFVLNKYRIFLKKFNKKY